MAYLHYRISQDENGGVVIADAFIKKVYSNFNITQGDPIGMFRTTVGNYMNNKKMKDIRTTGEGMRMLIYAWDKFVIGDKLIQAISLNNITRFMEVTKIGKTRLYIDDSGILQREL